MAIRFNHWVVLGASALLVGAVACGDDDDHDGHDHSTSSSSATTSGSTSATTGTSGSGPSDKCVQGCNELWKCTQADDADMMPFCPALKGGDAEAEKSFVDTCTSNPLCDGSASLVLGKECAEIIKTVSGLSADFKGSCEGMGAGGAGGASGAGGAGGGS